MSTNDFGMIILIYCFSAVTSLLIWSIVKMFVLKKKLREYQHEFERELEYKVERIVKELKDENKI